jgi:hypothetical protein
MKYMIRRLLIVSATTIAFPFSVAIGSTYKFCVANYYKIPISSQEVDDILRRSQKLLSTQSDNDCKAVSLSKLADPSSYHTMYPSSLGSSEDFKIFTADACIKIVERITWCGDGVVLPTGGALGCSPVPGNGLVVVRTYPEAPDEFNTGIEPITWLHEFGHTRGLRHNTSDADDIMATGLGLENTRITSSECATYNGTAPVAAAVPAIAATALPNVLPAEPAPQPTTSMPLEQFVKQLFTTSIPIEQAQRYSGEFKKAEELLTDPDYVAYRPNIIALLGVIGTPEALPLLKTVVDSPFGPRPTSSDIYARLAAPIAIGAISNRFHLPASDFDILRQASSPTFWEQRLALAQQGAAENAASLLQLPANGPQTGKQLDAEDIRSLVHDLSRQAYRGYAITGSAAAQDLLKQDQTDNAGAAIPAPQQRERNAQINEGIMLQKKSATDGALSTYQQP